MALKMKTEARKLEAKTGIWTLKGAAEPEPPRRTLAFMGAASSCLIMTIAGYRKFDTVIAFGELT